MKNVYLTSLVENIIHQGIGLTVFDRKLRKCENQNYNLEVSCIKNKKIYEGNVIITNNGMMLGQLKTEEGNVISFTFGYEGFKLVG